MAGVKTVTLATGAKVSGPAEVVDRVAGVQTKGDAPKPAPRKPVSKSESK